MSQPIELPQLSLQRYVDLVRRRRWQLLPVSLFGLAVGALVAFLIPRYYVAEATLQYERVDSGGERGGADDPFIRVVRQAEKAIPLLAGKAMERLKWPEALSPDASQRTLAEKAVRANIFAYDATAAERNRDIAWIRVTYKDTDAERSFTFVNELLETWKQDAVDKMLKRHQTELLQARDELRVLTEECNRHGQELADIERRFGLRPESELAQRDAMKEQRDRDAALEARWREKDAAARALAATLRADRERLGSLEARIVPKPADLTLIAVKKGMMNLVPEFRRLQLMRDELENNLTEGSKHYATVKRQIRMLEDQLLQQLAIELDAEGRMANAVYDELAVAVARDSRTLDGLNQEVAVLRQDLDARQAQLRALPVGQQEWRERRRQLDDAEAERRHVNERVSEHENKISKLQSSNPIQTVQRATKPPHPTDPNILVVALIGAVLGLGVAIGLILLLDVMQGSFKTVEDVERGLGLPVLGGMSHLETEAERQTVSRGRRRAGTAAVAVVALVVVVVTLYYRAPTRLPTVVRELLTLLLGS